jgi:hypothetical protein
MGYTREGVIDTYLIKSVFRRVELCESNMLGQTQWLGNTKSDL